MINDLHVVARICADTYPFDERVKLCECSKQIYLSKDHMNALNDKYIFTDIEPCYAKIRHTCEQCANCTPNGD